MIDTMVEFYLRLSEAQQDMEPEFAQAVDRRFIELLTGEGNQEMPRTPTGENSLGYHPEAERVGETLPDPDRVPIPGPMPPSPPPVARKGEILVSFESGHYKKVKGSWKGDSVWCHINKDSGGQVHINKEKVEYIETY